MSTYSLKPVPQAATTLIDRLTARAIEIDHRLGPIPGSVADCLARELREAADALKSNLSPINRLTEQN